MTSSPGPIRSAISATISASVPDETPTAWPARQWRRASSCSSAVDLRAADEPLTVADAGDCGKDLVAKRTILLLQIEKRDVHGRGVDQRVTISGAPQSGRSFRLSAR